jgi:hypothetical protein
MPDLPEAVFTASFDREVRVSADRRRITHRARSWSSDYTPAQLHRWIEFYERIAADPRMSASQADVEVLHAARDLIARESNRACPRSPSPTTHL